MVTKKESTRSTFDRVSGRLGTLSNLLPQKPIVDYGMARDQIVQEAVPFLLRGMGVTDEAIAKHYNPETIGRMLG